VRISFVCVPVSNGYYCLLIMTVFVGRNPILHNVAGKADFTLNAIDRAISPNYTLAISMHGKARATGNQTEFICISDDGFVSWKADYTQLARML